MLFLQLDSSQWPALEGTDLTPLLPLPSGPHDSHQRQALWYYVGRAALGFTEGCSLLVTDNLDMLGSSLWEQPSNIYFWKLVYKYPSCHAPQEGS